MSLVSYAQNFEDVLLHRVFGGQETGFYVDIGAYHPIIGSVTKLFYDLGWSGINVEPGSVFTELAAARPRDVNLQMAVFDRAGEVAFIEDESDRGSSHLAIEESTATPTRTVPCDTLETIVRAHAHNRPIDFIKVDAEGTESAIVHSTDWRRLRPRVLMLEATLPWSNVLTNQDWEPILLEQGYVRVYFDGINCFYVPEENVSSLRRHFETPVNALDRAIRYEEDRLRMAVNERTQEAERLAGELAKQSSVLDERLEEMTRLRVDRDTLRAELDQNLEEMTRLTTDRDALRAELDECLEQMARPAPDQKAPAQPPAAALTEQSARRRMLRRIAKSAYMPVRPLVRPVLWRLRSFMTAGLVDEVRHLQDRIDTLAAHQQRPLPDATPTVTAGSEEAVAELRHLAVQMERALLTMVVEQEKCPQERGPRMQTGS